MRTGSRASDGGTEIRLPNYCSPDGEWATVIILGVMPPKDTIAEFEAWNWAWITAMKGG